MTPHLCHGSKMAVKRHEVFDFLRDMVKDVPAMSSEDSKKKEPKATR